MFAIVFLCFFHSLLDETLYTLRDIIIGRTDAMICSCFDYESISLVQIRRRLKSRVVKRMIAGESLLARQKKNGIALFDEQEK